jgi:hypothetical protein
MTVLKGETKMKRSMVAVMLIGVLWTAGPVVAEVNMQEGNWESTIEMKMEGMPFPVPPMTYKVTQCLTKKDMVPNMAKKDQKCEVKNQKVSGSKVSWTVVCVDPEGRSEGEGEITYSGNAYQGTMKMKLITKDGPQPLRSTMKMDGKRLGNCTK